MALFDRASLVQIPSGYKEGKLYNIKPFDQPFEFERGSAATRVNEDGLIEFVGIGSENVTNSDFDTTDSWSTGSTISSFSVTDGVATVQGDANSFNTRISQSLTLEASTTYLINVSIKSNDGNYWRVRGYDNVRGYFDIEFDNSSEFSEINYVYTTASAFNGAFILYFSSHYENGSEDFSINFASIKQISNDTPRIDYTNGKALLLEPQRTNLITYSEDFSQWSNVELNITPNQSSPSGDNTASLITTTGTTFGWLRQQPTVTGDQTISFYAKAESSSIISVYMVQSPYPNVRFTLTGDGSMSTQSVIDSTISSVGNGWYRCTMTYNSTSSYEVRFQPNDLTNETIGDSVYIWGAQLEQGSYATSYIPTNGQTETRLADECTGGGDESTFNDSEGVLYLEFSTRQDNAASFITVSDGSITNRIALFNQNGVELRSNIRLNSAQYNNLSGVNVSDGENHKIAVKYDGSNIKLFLDGQLKDTDPYSGTFSASLNTIEFFQGDGVTSGFNGNVKMVAYFPEALTDTELQELTTI